MTETKTKALAGVKSVYATLDIIEIVATASDEIGVSEIASRLGLTKASVFRHVKTLVDRGFLSQNVETTRYGLGTRLYVLGQLAASRVDLLSVCDPHMRQLRDETKLTVNLAGFTPRGVVVLRSMMGPAAMEIGVKIGSEFPYHASSQGHIALAYTKDAFTALFKQKREALTSHTITDLGELEKTARSVISKGWAATPQHTILGINAVSAPIFDASASCTAAITLVGALQFLPDPPTGEQIAALKSAAERISADLGYRKA